MIHEGTIHTALATRLVAREREPLVALALDCARFVLPLAETRRA